MFEGTDSMEGPPTYLKGDIVWVKLSGYWWPGEVINEEDLPSGLLSDFKKPPLVIVKFFEEDSYEYIKQWSGIYPYNCEKKSEFIKKGMAGYRSKLSHMAKFPRDIGTAEEKTNGNPNILSQPEFLPNKKINYDEIFGTPPPKKSSKGKNPSSVSKKSTAKDNNEPLITHRRFLGNDDYRAYIWIQYPGKDREADEEIGEIQRLNEEPKEFLTCQACMFKTKRLGVMLMHTKMHLNGVNITPKRKNKKAKPVDLSDSDTEALTVKSPKPKQRKKKEEKKSKPRDVFTDLLEEWDDTDEETDGLGNKSVKAKNQDTEIEKDNIDIASEDTSEAQAEKSTANHASDSSVVVETPKSLLGGKNTQDDIKNCFDFDEEEEEEDFLLPASSGRKIPRVIPEKPKASISELLEISQKEDDLYSIEKVIETPGGPSVKPTESESTSTNKEIPKSSETPSADETMESTFRELMEETEVPAVDDLSQTLKPEQNFYDARAVKFPDKGGTTLKGGTPLKSGTSRKRFVTSFEDFEAGFRKIKDEESSRISAEREGKLNKKAIVTTPKKIDIKYSSEQIPEPSNKNIRKKKTSSNECAPDFEPHQEKIVIGDSVLTRERKTRQSEAKQHNLSILEEFKDLDHIEIEPEKKVRRRTKQLVINEDSEEVIELTQHDRTDKLVVEAEKIVNQLDKEARDNIAAFDAELEAIKKDLQVSPKIALSAEKSKETRMSLEQLTRELEGSCDSVDNSEDVEPDKTSDSQQSHYQKTRRKTKSIGSIDVGLDSTVSRRKKEKLMRSLKEDSQSAKLQETGKLPVEEAQEQGHENIPSTSSRRSRSRSLQKELSALGHPEGSDVNAHKGATTFETEAEKEPEVSKRKSLRNKHHKRQAVSVDDTHESLTESHSSVTDNLPPTNDLKSLITEDGKESEEVSCEMSSLEAPVTQARHQTTLQVESAKVTFEDETAAKETEAISETATISEEATYKYRKSRFRRSVKNEEQMVPENKKPDDSVQSSDQLSVERREDKQHSAEQRENIESTLNLPAAEEEKLPEPPKDEVHIDKVRKNTRHRHSAVEIPAVNIVAEPVVDSNEGTAGVGNEPVTCEASTNRLLEDSNDTSETSETKTRKIIRQRYSEGDIVPTDAPAEHVVEDVKVAETTSKYLRSRARKHSKMGETSIIPELTSEKLEADETQEISKKALIDSDVALGRVKIDVSSKLVEKTDQSSCIEETDDKKATVSENKGLAEPKLIVEPLEETVSKVRRGRSRKSTKPEESPDVASVVEEPVVAQKVEADIPSEEAETKTTTFSEVTVESVQTVAETPVESTAKVRRGRSRKSTKIEEPLDVALVGVGPSKVTQEKDNEIVENPPEVPEKLEADICAETPDESKVRRGRSRKSKTTEPLDAGAIIEDKDAALGHEHTEEFSRKTDRRDLEVSSQQIVEKLETAENLTDLTTSEAVAEHFEEASPKMRRGRPRKSIKIEGETSVVEVDRPTKIGDVALIPEVSSKVTESVDAERIGSSQITAESVQLETSGSEAVDETPVSKVRRGRSRKSFEEPLVAAERGTTDVPAGEVYMEKAETSEVTIENAALELTKPVEKPIPKLRRGKSRKMSNTEEPLEVAPIVQEPSKASETNDSTLGLENAEEIAEKLDKTEPVIITKELDVKKVDISESTSSEVVEPADEPALKVRRGRSRKSTRIEETFDATPNSEEMHATGIKSDASSLLKAEILDKPSAREETPETSVGSADNLDSNVIKSEVVAEPSELAPKLRRGRSRTSTTPAVEYVSRYEKEHEIPQAMDGDSLAQPEAILRQLETTSDHPEEPCVKIRRGKSRRSPKTQVEVDSGLSVMEELQMSSALAESSAAPKVVEAVIEPSGEPSSKIEQRSMKIGESLDVAQVVEEPEVGRGRSRKGTRPEESLDIVSVVEESDIQLNHAEEPRALSLIQESISKEFKDTTVEATVPETSSCAPVEETKQSDVKLVEAETGEKTSENDRTEAVKTDVIAEISSEKSTSRRRRGKSRWDTIETHIDTPSIIEIPEPESVKTVEVTETPEAPIEKSESEPVLQLLSEHSPRRKGRSRWHLEQDTVMTLEQPSLKDDYKTEVSETVISELGPPMESEILSEPAIILSEPAVSESVPELETTKKSVGAQASANESVEVHVEVPSEPPVDERSEAPSELELKSEENDSKELSSKLTSKESEASTSKDRRSKSRKHSHLDKVVDVELTEKTAQSSESADDKVEAGLEIEVTSTDLTPEKNIFTELPFELIGMLEKRKSGRRYDKSVGEKSASNESEAINLAEESSRGGRDRKRKLSGESVPKEVKEDNRRSKYHKKVKPDVVEPAQLDSSSQNEELNQRLTENVDTHREVRSSRSRDSRKDKREGRRSRSPKQLVTDASTDKQRIHEDYSRDSRKERERRRRSRSPKKLLANLDRIREDRIARSRDSRKEREERRRSRSPKQMFGDNFGERDRRSRSHDSKKEREEKYRSKSYRKSKTSKPDEPSHSDAGLDDLSKPTSEPEQPLQSLSEGFQDIATYTAMKEDGFEGSSPRKTTFTGIVSDTVYGRKSKTRPARSKLSRWDVVTRPDDQAYEKDAAHLIPEDLPKIDDKPSEKPDVLVEKVRFCEDELVMTNHERNKVNLETDTSDKDSGVNFEHQIEEIPKVQAGVFEPSKEPENDVLKEKDIKEKVAQDLKSEDSATESRSEVESVKELAELQGTSVEMHSEFIETHTTVSEAILDNVETAKSEIPFASAQSEVSICAPHEDLETKFMDEETVEHKPCSRKKRSRSRRSRSITDHISPERDVVLAVEGNMEAPPSKTADETKAIENVSMEAESGAAIFEDNKIDSKLDSAMDQDNIDSTLAVTNATVVAEVDTEDISIAETLQAATPQGTLSESMEIDGSATEHTPDLNIPNKEALDSVVVESVREATAEEVPYATVNQDDAGIKTEDLSTREATAEDVTLSSDECVQIAHEDVEVDVEVTLTQEASEAAAYVGDIEAEDKLDFAVSHGESNVEDQTEIPSAAEEEPQTIVLEEAVIDVRTDSIAAVAEAVEGVVENDSSIAPGGIQDQIVAEDLSLTKVEPEPLILEANDNVTMNDISVAHNDIVVVRYSGAEDLSTKDRMPPSSEEVPCSVDDITLPPVAAASDPSPSVPPELLVSEPAQTLVEHFEDRPLSPKDQIEIPSEVAKAIDVLETDLSKEAASDSEPVEPSHKALCENEGEVAKIVEDSTDSTLSEKATEPQIVTEVLDEKVLSPVPKQELVDFSGQQTEPQDLSPSVVESSEEPSKGLQSRKSSIEQEFSVEPEKLQATLPEGAEQRETEQVSEEAQSKSRLRKCSKQKITSEGPVDYSIKHLNEDLEKESDKADEESIAEAEIETGGEEKNREQTEKYSEASAEISDQKSPEIYAVPTETTIPDDILPEISKNKPSADILKSMPPKKSRWSRRASYTKKDSDNEQETASAPAQVEEKPVDLESAVIEKTDQQPLESNTQENSSSSLNDNEIILPPKKSKRVSEVSSQLFSDDFQSPEKKSDADSLCFPSYDDSFMSTTLRNNIEGLIKEIDSIDSNVIPDHLELQTAETDFKPFEMPGEVKSEAPSSEHLLASSPLSEDSRGGLKEGIEIPKGVPPKKKKIDLPKEEHSTLPPNNLSQQDVSKSEEKAIDAMPQPPKKKMQKLFENSQAVEKVDKPADFLLMSPLAKKKSFLFHHEEFDPTQKVEDTSLPRTETASKEVDKTSDPPRESLYSTEVDVDEFLDLPKIRKKRKSSSLRDYPPKKEKLDEKAIITEDHDQKRKAAETPLSDITGFSTPVDEDSKPSTSTNEMEVKIEESDFKFNIQTNLSILSTSKAEELSALATKTLSEIKKDVITECPRAFVKTEKQQQVLMPPSKSVDDVKPEAAPQLHPPVPGSTLNEPELVPISVTPTVMSEKDLADAQVEITTDKVISEKKPTVPKDFVEHAVKTVGTEFTSKAMVKEFDNRPLTSQPNAYALKSELLDILEGNSNSSTNSSGSEQKFKTSFDNYDKNTTVQGIIDFEEAIPSQIVLSNKVSAESVLMDSPKLLERLSMSSDSAKAKAPSMLTQGDVKVNESLSKALMTKLTKASGGIPKPGQKIVIKTQKAVSKGTKPIILSEQIIRPAIAAPSAAKSSGQAQGLKRQYEDVEDVETAFIIPKIAKKAEEEKETAPPTPVEKPTRARGSKISGKAKILQQTIITPKGEVIPQAPSTTTAQTIQLQQVQIQPGQDDAVFDINSMPIVLSDDILTPESIQNMPVVLSEEVLSRSTTTPAAKGQEKPPSALPKKIVSGIGTKQPGSVAPVPPKHAGKARILSTSSAASSSKIAKPTATALLATGTTADGKPAKYVLVPPSVTPATTQVKTVKQVVKKQPVVPSKLPTAATATATATEQSGQVVGNKIMIVTNAQGQQTRVVLTPQQQKAFMQAQPGSKTKAIIKGAIPKALLESAAAAGPSGVPKTVAPVAVPGPAPSPVSSHGGVVMPAVKNVKTPVPPKKSVQKSTSKPQKTILIKNQLGQTVRKIQGTDDDDLDRQVAEQLEAIKASARLQQANKTPEIINYTNRQIPSANNRSAMRKSYSKKVDPLKVKIPAPVSQTEAQKPAEIVPALAPISPQSRIPQVQNQTPQTVTKQAPPRKVEPPAASVSVNKTLDTSSQLSRQQTTVPVKCDSKTQAAPPKEVETKRPDSPLRQVVIQDGLGNLTTVTVGQILAIPSETVDGQPQSYMLVTVDESGNLTPLNNDALMSLDPSLGAAGDVNNMMLQVDQGQQGTVAAIKPAESTVAHAPIEEKKKVEERMKPEPQKPAQLVKESKATPVLQQAKPHEVPLAVEQQIVIGEGVLPGDAGGQQLIVTGDPIATQKFLESLSDGSTDLANILANAEGGSVLIQADGQQILIRTNPGAQPMMGITESTEGGGNPIFATHKPNQDILAAALANTDVFQPTDQLGSQTSPVKGLQHSQLSPGGGAGLYPMHVGNVLETSLTLSSPIMTPLEVPSTNSKKIDDEADILNQVPKNVDLPITITDPNISQTVAHQQAVGLMELTLPISETGPSADINSPSYSYSLPTLDESVGMSQKSFSSSMPLLTEDVVEIESSGSSNLRICKGLKVAPSSFSPNFGSLPMLTETIESSREEVVKTSAFGDIESLPMLADDVIEDSGSSVGSTKPARSSPKPIERDIVDEGLSTLGGEMCSSLSEPPPDMFDLSSLTHKEEEVSSDVSSIPEPETLSINSENSGEIPIQPPIVATLSDLKRCGDDSDGSDEKRARFD